MDHDIPSFRGFGPGVATFYRELEANNSKAYFDDHRQVYDVDIREPMERLLAEVAEEFGVDGKVFRPNRDVRFSKDKSPYKLNCSAIVGHGDAGSAVHYLAVGAEGLFAGSGFHMMSRDQLQRFYDAIDHDRTGPALEALVDVARDAGATIGGSELKTSPRGYDNDHPRVRLLRHKGLTVSRSWPVHKWLQTREALRRTTAAWREAQPINAWLQANVGPARQANPGRPR